MNADDRSTHAEALFGDVLDLPPEARASFLAVAGGPDPDLRREVERMLESLAEADRYFHELGSRIRGSDPAGALDVIAGFRSDEAEIGPDVAPFPTRVGPFRLARLLGRGGMGAVFLGKRDGDFEQLAAIKLLPVTARTEVFLRRFASERRILARLEHPNIARLIDGGLLGDGTPYLIMEYVAGTPIDVHADARVLDVDARLSLFRQVCDAVHFAHENLIVHRDLKPANVLVTSNGVAKLLDFGIAKLLDERAAAEPTLLTRAGGRPMTPAYSSPEQVCGGPLTTAADIYSLGALLYHLLAGRPPLDVAGLTPAELEHAVRTRDPVPPSEAVAQAGHGRDRLRRRLRGDLDTIVLKALRKDPRRRYASVAQLSDDIDRFLTGRPVSARPDSIAYRARRFVARHPWSSAAAVLLPVTVVSALAVHSARLQAERDVARTAAASAERVSEFLAGLFEAADPAETRGEDVSVADILERGAARIGDLGDDPLVQARMMSVLARVNHSLGRIAPSLELAEFALATRRAVLGDMHPDVARSLDDLGLILAASGELERAEAAHREALGIALATHGPNHEDRARVLNNLGAVLRGRGDLDGAAAAYEEALASRRRRFGDRSEEVATSLNNLGVLAHARGRFGEAESLWREALDIRTERLGEDHPATLTTMSNLAAALHAAADFAAAEAAYLDVLRVRRRVLGADHPDVATTLHQVGFARWSAGDRDGAEEAWREALSLRRAALGEDHPDVAQSLNALAAVARSRGDLAESERLLEAVLARYRSTFGDDHVNVAVVLNNLGAVRFARGDVAGGRALYRQALRIRVAAQGEDHPEVAAVLHNLGESYLDTGDRARARDHLARALAMREAALGPDHSLTVETRDRLAEAQTSDP